MTESQKDAWEWGLRLQSESLGHIVTVSAGALTILVTFRQALLGGTPEFVWALSVSWIGFALSVVAAVLGKGVTGVALTEMVTTPIGSPRLKLLAGISSLVALGSFAVGVVGLIVFGLANLMVSKC